MALITSSDKLLYGTGQGFGSICSFAGVARTRD